MMGFQIKVRDTATPRAAAVVRAYERGGHLRVVAHSAANTVKDHFQGLERARHRGGRFHFWRRAASATKGEVHNGRATVVIDQEGVALRFFGGTVRPRVGKYLTIPVDERAYGRRVREFNDVRFIINRRTEKGVAMVDDRVLFALTTEAKHAPDPSVLPDEKELMAQVKDDLAVWTKLQEDRANG